MLHLPSADCQPAEGVCSPLTRPVIDLAWSELGSDGMTG
jgi:hypothetical protein